MYSIRARNVNEALQIGAMAINNRGKKQQSRNGEVLAFDEPVSTEYLMPQEKVIFFEERDANPFFHFFEAFWMLMGSDDLHFVRQFNNRMAEYSDDGQTLNGSAYGKRWKNHFVESENLEHGPYIDQLDVIASYLKKDPNNRRLVLSMWDASQDLTNQKSKDLPCNLQVCFRPQEQRLNMTVYNRSNDMVWGAYGANAVQFGTLLEYLASKAGMGIGTYHQVSNNFHVYTENPVWQRCKDLRTGSACYYERGIVQPYPLMTHPESFDEELKQFIVFGVNQTGRNYKNPIFLDVALPLWKAWCYYKGGDLQFAMKEVAHCAATDWSLAAKQWLGRRLVKYEKRRLAEYEKRTVA
jgi:thymidylate synthase